MKNVLTLAVLALGSVAALSAQNAPAALPRVAPTVDQILSLKRVGSPEISLISAGVAQLAWRYMIPSFVAGL